MVNYIQLLSTESVTRVIPTPLHPRILGTRLGLYICKSRCVPASFTILIKESDNGSIEHKGAKTKLVNANCFEL